MPSYNNNHLDDTVNSEFMRVCKCMIPYLDRDIQKNAAVGLKFLELINTINAYSNDTMISDLSLTRQGNWEHNLLSDVRSNLSPEKAYIIDALMKLKEFRSILETKDTDAPVVGSVEPLDSPEQTSFYADSSTDNRTPNPSTISPNNILQAISPLLDDNQKQLLNLFAGFLGSK